MIKIINDGHRHSPKHLRWMNKWIQNSLTLSCSLKSRCPESCQHCWRASHSKYQASRSGIGQPKLYLGRNYSSGPKIMTCFAQWVIYSDIMQILAWFFNLTWPKQFLKLESTLCWSILFSCVPVWAVLLYRCDVMALKFTQNMTRTCVCVFLTVIGCD